MQIIRKAATVSNASTALQLPVERSIIWETQQSLFTNRYIPQTMLMYTLTESRHCHAQRLLCVPECAALALPVTGVLHQNGCSSVTTAAVCRYSSKRHTAVICLSILTVSIKQFNMIEVMQHYTSRPCLYRANICPLQRHSKKMNAVTNPGLMLWSLHIRCQQTVQTFYNRSCQQQLFIHTHGECQTVEHDTGNAALHKPVTEQT